MTDNEKAKNILIDNVFAVEYIHISNPEKILYTDADVQHIPSDEFILIDDKIYIIVSKFYSPKKKLLQIKLRYS